jgi:multidrug efflux system membrane fusion protein
MLGRILPVLLASLVLAASGCEQKQAPASSNEVLAIPVSKPVVRMVTDYVDFTGRTDAVEAVDIRARVTGYLVKAPFREGQEVRGDDRVRGGVRVAGMLATSLGQGPLLAAAGLYPGTCQPGDLLFEVDSKPYRAQLDYAHSQIALNRESLRLAQSILDIDESINAKTPGAISYLQINQEKAAVEEAKARVKGSQSNAEIYELNLGYTKVTAPIDGQVSRYYLTLGNIVLQDQTLLTTVVSLDPIYAYFDMDEPTLQRIRRAINEGRIKRPEDGVFPVYMGLQVEDGFPHEGTIDFVNNQVNPATGSISVRGIFPNPKPPGGVRLLSPGMFVRIRMPIGRPYEAKLVMDRFIGSDQGDRYVYVVKEGDKVVQQRKVTTGPLQRDGLRVIITGLEDDDLVVTGALQQVRQKMQIRPELRDMPK